MSLSQFQNELIAKPCEQINRWIAPLKQALDVDYFCYEKVSSDGNFVGLSNDPDYVEFYLENKLFHFDSCLTHPSNYRDPVYMLPIRKQLLEESNPLFELLRRASEKFSFHQSILLTFSQGESYETFCFATQSDDFRALHRLMSEMDIIKKFLGFIHPKLDALISKKDLVQFGIDLNHYKGTDFQKNQMPENYFLSEETKRSLLAEITPTPVREFKQNLSTLTPRELQCVQQMSAGSSSSETARVLGISSRTVEQHLAQAKRKLDAKNQAHLAYQFGKYSYLC